MIKVTPVGCWQSPTTLYQPSSPFSLPPHQHPAKRCREQKSETATVIDFSSLKLETPPLIDSRCACYTDSASPNFNLCIKRDASLGPLATHAQTLTHIHPSLLLPNIRRPLLCLALFVLFLMHKLEQADLTGPDGAWQPARVS